MCLLVAESRIVFLCLCMVWYEWYESMLFIALHCIALRESRSRSISDI